MNPPESYRTDAVGESGALPQQSPLPNPSPRHPVTTPALSPTSAPTTVLAALFDAPGRPFRLEMMAPPRLADGEALAAIECCTVCGSDLHTVTGARREATPSILGHEFLGRVAGLGPNPPRCLDGEPLQIGDRVTWSTVIACGRCDRCRRGIPQKCRHLAKYGHERAEGRLALSGGLAEAIVLRPGSSIVRVPEEIPEEAVCPVNCATATAAAAVRAVGPLGGRRVLLLGAGMLGLTAAAMAATRAAAQVVVCDPDPDRLAETLRFGAGQTVRWQSDRDALHDSLRAITGEDGFDAVIEMSGAADAVEMACVAGGIGSRVALVGTVMKSRPVAIDPEAVVRKCQTIVGVHNYVPDDLRDAVAFLRERHRTYPFAELVRRSFRLSEVNEAMAYAVRERPIRIAVRPSGSNLNGHGN